MKKLTFTIIFAALSLSVLGIFPTTLFAADLALTNYYPALSGNYDRLQLRPRTVNLTGACISGTLYVNSSNTLQYCNNSTWSGISDVWTQTGDNIYLTDNATIPDLHVGIGTKTPEFKLSISGDAGIIAKGTFGSGTILPDGIGAGSRLIWYPLKAAFRAGFVSGAQWDDANIGDYSAAFGKDSTASGAYSVVGGGDTNTASGQYSNVIGGQSNIASGNYSAIIGGKSNTASGLYTTTTGGLSNSASANYATVLGGQSNQSAAIYATVGGGLSNVVSTPYSNINGGKANTIDQISGAAIGYSVIGGGNVNKARNDYTVVSGGNNNTTLAPYASVGGGDLNQAGLFKAAEENNCPPCSPSWPTVCPMIACLSLEDSFSGNFSRISGGQNNLTTGKHDAIGGGKNNIAGPQFTSSVDSYATIAGGFENAAVGAYSSVGAGERNTAWINFSMIIGGTDNFSIGQYSWADGMNMRLLNADHSFAWGYTDAPIEIGTDDAFIIAPGMIGGSPWNPKVGIRDITPVGVLEINANSTANNFITIKEKVGAKDIFVVKSSGYIGVQKTTPTLGTHVMQFGNANDAHLTAGGAWTNGSSRSKKENIKSLSLKDAQSTLDELAPVTFNYKATAQQTNVGFIAEDVPAIVAMNDRKSLSSMDIIAVLTKVSQDQEQQINDQKLKIEKIKSDIDVLQKMLGE